MLKYLIKFFPSILVLIAFHFLSLYYKCRKENEDLISTGLLYDEIYTANNAAVKNLATNEYKCHLFAFDL